MIYINSLEFKQLYDLNKYDNDIKLAFLNFLKEINNNDISFHIVDTFDDFKTYNNNGFDILIFPNINLSYDKFICMLQYENIQSIKPDIIKNIMSGVHIKFLKKPHKKTILLFDIIDTSNFHEFIYLIKN
jgi:hypothetical protein